MKRSLLTLFVQFCLAVGASAQNNLPSIDPPKSMTVVAQTQGCFYISTQDLDANDSTTLSVQSAVTGYSFSDNNGAVKHAEGELCWTPSLADTVNSPHPFYLTVSDGKVQVSDTFWFTVIAGPALVRHEILLDSCGELTLDNEANAWTTQTELIIKDSTGSNLLQTSTISHQTHLTPGTYILWVTLSNNVPLITRYIDTIHVIHGIDIRGVNTSFDSSSMEFVFEADDRSLDAITYQWIREDGPNQYSTFNNTGPVLRIQLWESASIGCIASNAFGCQDTFIYVIQVDPNSIHTIDPNFSLFPNPTSEFLNIETENSQTNHYIIQSIDGKMMIRGQLHPERNTISVTGLQSGVYFISIVDQQGNLIRKKFVVQR